jgi:hypothetical protein
MSDLAGTVKLGQKVPDFELNIEGAGAGQVHDGRRPHREGGADVRRLRREHGTGAEFKANLYMAKKPTEVCPSKWKDEGDATLTPSAELVGKVHEALQR